MPGSVYIQPSEYSAYGVEATVTPDLVAGASNLVDGYLKRTGGLVWSPDAAGVPAYMAALTTALAVQGVADAAPGSGVVVQYSGGLLDNNAIGEAVVLDRTVTNKTEVCVITAVSAPGAVPTTLTLRTVQFAHTAGYKIEFGLCLMEEKEMPKDRSTSRLSDHPIMRLHSGVGRYGYGRRSSQITGNMQEFNLLATVSAFGGPPLWIPWDTTQASVSQKTGEIWVPAGILLAYYSDIRVWYVAGYSKDNIPDPVKRATANIVKMIQTTGLGPNIRQRGQRDGVMTMKFENNLIDFNTREILQPFAARNWS